MINILRSWVDRYFGNEEAVIFAILLVAALLVILSIGSILAPVIAGLIIAFLMQGVVARLKSWRAPHSVAVAIATLMLMGMITAAIVFIIPVIWQQSTKLVAELPGMFTHWQEILQLLPERYPSLISSAQIDKIIETASSEIGTFGQGVLSFSLTNFPLLFVVAVYLVLVPILVFFFLKDSGQITQWLSAFLPSERPMMNQVWREMNVQVANYVRGKTIEILIVGLVSYLAFLFLDLRYALLLGILVGFSVVIPYIGAFLVTIPVLLVGYFQWGLTTEFYWLAIVYTVIQGLDGNVLVPILFSEAVNLHPVAIIVAVLLFGGLWGLWGVFFAIPLATLIKAILSAWPVHQEEQSA